MKNKVIELIKKSSIFIYLEIVILLISTTLLFLLKVSISPLHLPISFLLTIVLYFILYRKDEKKINIIAIAIAVLIFGCITFFEGKIYDSTADGNTYHKLAIGCLKNGWNPCYESSQDFDKEQGNVFDTSEDNINTLWIDHYAKGAEIFAAVVYDFTGNIESGKGYTLLLMYASFGIVISYLIKDKKKSIISSALISILLVFNTITIAQIFNYYVDGALMISILMILYGLIRECEENTEKSNENLLILACNIILCINLKFTGVAFAAIYCFAFYVYWLIRAYRKSKEEFNKKLKKYTLFYFVTVIVSICIVGFSSYTKNFIDYAHPLYPLYGKGHVDNMVVMEQPLSFQNKNHLEIFLYSIFSKGENVSPSYSSENVQPTLKIPFTILKGEIENYCIPDIRVGGFGPLFSAIFIASVLGTIYIIYKLILQKKWNILIPYAIILGITGVLILALDGNYWARYIPYFYSVPILVITYFLWSKERKIEYFLGFIISAIMMVNCFLVTYTVLRSTKRTNNYIETRVTQFIEYYNNSEDGIEIKLNHEGLQGVLYNLDDWGVTKYTVNKDKEFVNDGFMFKY